MLYYFMMHPSHWYVPAIVTLFIHIVFVRFFGHRLKGEARIFNEPWLIPMFAAAWPLTVTGLVFSGIMWVASKAVGALTGYKARP